MIIGATANRYDSAREFVKWINRSRVKKLKYPLTKYGVGVVVDALEIELSPENLYCDGELNTREATAKARKLKKIML